MPDPTSFTLYVASQETFEPMRAGLVLRAAIAARKAGGGARVALLGAAISLMKPSTAKKTITVAIPASGKSGKSGKSDVTVEKRTLQSLIDEAKGLGVICFT
jgi:hypothetical protein